MENWFQRVNVVLTQYAGLSTKYERFSLALTVRGFVLFMHFCPFYVTNWEAVEYLPNEMDKFIYKSLMNLSLAMSIVSYLIASYRQPKILTTTAQDESLSVDAQDEAFCLACQQWKAPRAHHCQMCGKCVPRMDHHCFLMVNCIGYHNLKPFFLFCNYQMWVLLLWLSIVSERFFGDDGVKSMSALGTFFFWVTLIITVPYFFFMALLFLRTFSQMYSNLTTIEALGAWRGNKHGPAQERLPCIGIRKSQQGNMPNQYDLLWPNNFRLVMGANALTWMLPWVIPDSEEHGYNFQRIPEVTAEEVVKLEREGFLSTMQSEQKVKYELKEKFNSSIDDYVQKAMNKYQNANIVLQKTPITVREKVDAQALNEDIQSLKDDYQ